MAVIYLRNAQGGCKVATMEQEAAYDESNGWVRFDPSLPVEPVPVVEAKPPIVDLPPLPELEDLQLEYEIKFGREPHPGWDIPTLTEKLAAQFDPLDHDFDGRKGGSLPRRGRPRKNP